MEHRKLTTGYSPLTKVQDDLICTQRLVIQRQKELLKSYKAIIEEESCETMILDLEPLANEKEDNDIILILTKKK